MTTAAATGMICAHPASTTGWKTVRANAKLLNTESWIMGGSGLPIPPQSYLDALSEKYIDPTSPPPSCLWPSSCR